MKGVLVVIFNHTHAECCSKPFLVYPSTLSSGNSWLVIISLIGIYSKEFFLFLFMLGVYCPGDVHLGAFGGLSTRQHLLPAPRMERKKKRKKVYCQLCVDRSVAGPETVAKRREYVIAFVGRHCRSFAHPERWLSDMTWFHSYHQATVSVPIHCRTIYA